MRCTCLKTPFGLRSYPYRIEAFDVSNLAGAEAMGSMAVFIDRHTTG